MALGNLPFDSYMAPLGTGRAVIAVANTAVLIGTSAANIVIIQALKTNTGSIMIGGPLSTDSDVTDGSENGIELESGQTITLPIRELGRGTTKGIWIDGETVGDGISYFLLG